jgi:hypothetical protein
MLPRTMKNPTINPARFALFLNLFVSAPRTSRRRRPVCR